MLRTVVWRAFVVVLVYLFSPQPCFAGVRLEAALGSQGDTYLSAKSNAILELTFTSTYFEEKRLPLRRRWLVSRQTAKSSKESYGVVGSKLRCRWRMLGTTNYHESDYEIFGEDFRVSRFAKHTLRVPITLPSAPGSYQLILSFDNSNMSIRSAKCVL